MKKHADSHLDHGLTEAQVNHIMGRFADRQEFFVETFELPPELGTVPCGLYGPLVGDPPVEGAYLARRGGRLWDSRIIARPPRPTRTVTVIAGPHYEEPCVLYTAFGGPATPQEPSDPACKDVEASEKFWAQHALAEDA